MRTLSLQTCSRAVLSLAGAVVISAASLATSFANEGAAVLYPVGDQYVGGFAAYGNTSVEESEAKDLLTISNEKTAGFVRWFVKHDPLPVGVASEWKDGVIQLEMRAPGGSASVKVIASWRGQLEPTESSKAVEEMVTVGDAWTKVTIPVPDVEGMESTKLTGLFLRFEPGAKYEIKGIEILPKGSAGSN